MYRTAVEHKGYRSRFDGNELYKACRSIRNITGGLVLDGSKYRKNRLVAFWCDYDKRVKAGFGASDYEKDCIWNYFL